MKIGYIEVGEKPRIIESDASLKSLQSLVGGDIEPFDVLFGMSPSIYVNEEGLLQGLEPNRAVFATEEMVEHGYASQVDYTRVVREGELYQILHGPIVAVSYEEDPETGDVAPRDITQEEFEALCTELGDEDSGYTAKAMIWVANAFGGWVRRDSGEVFVDKTITAAA